ncbi:MAG TPA: RNB domain-containing ribonuclease, partial [Kiloniellaceae bacterium]|nr:RNB domain-containing ribonuclease [Kiloniellaceae bacterium]
ARELERLGQLCMYRVHDKPDPVRLKALAEVLRGLGLRLNASQVVRPRMLTQLLVKVAGQAEAGLVNDLILRAQSQAIYSPENIGHFGLALTHYAHFTSPIRRYADLLVHRALIAALGLGKDGLPPDAEGRFDEAASHISTTERQAAAAERDAVDRFTAAFLQDRVGADFSGRINGVTRFGLFITLDDSGADGLVPISTLPDDFYRHVEARHSLEGERWGRVYRLGDRVRVRLLESNPVTGGLILALLESGEDSIEDSESSQDSREKWDPLNAPRTPGAKARKLPQKPGRKKNRAKPGRKPTPGTKGRARRDRKDR